MTDMPNISDRSDRIENFGITRLDGEMRQVLAEMALLSYGRTSQWDSKGSTGKPGAVILDRRMTGQVLHDFWAGRYADQRSDEGRREMIDAARVELQNVRVQKERPVGESDEQKRKRCLRDCRGMAASEAADYMRETTRWVISVRTMAGLDPNTGKPFAVFADWRETVLDLNADGVLSLRDIAQRVGKSHEAVRQVTRRAA